MMSIYWEAEYMKQSHGNMQICFPGQEFCLGEDPETLKPLH